MADMTTRAREVEAKLREAAIGKFMSPLGWTSVIETECVTEAAATLAALIAECEWRDIGTAPWSGPPVLLWKESTKEHYVAARVTGAHGPGWCTPDGYEIFRATHWRPLPPPPQPVPVGALRCTGCGSTETLEEIRAKHPGAIACCPERDMQPEEKGETK